MPRFRTRSATPEILVRHRSLSSFDHDDDDDNGRRRCLTRPSSSLFHRRHLLRDAKRTPGCLPLCLSVCHRLRRHQGCERSARHRLQSPRATRQYPLTTYGAPIQIISGWASKHNERRTEHLDGALPALLPHDRFRPRTGRRRRVLGKPAAAFGFLVDAWAIPDTTCEQWRQWDVAVTGASVWCW